ncbi:hypothetical protein TH8_19690 [Thalassospira profundimaris]|nr:hypothetical protein TH8_19690 [Thalassospira profundimaris]
MDAVIQRLRDYVAKRGKPALHVSDIRAVLDRLQDVSDENAMLNDANLGLAARVKTQAEALAAVHKDLIDRADPDGTVAVGASVWITLDEAVEGGA